jgi:biopolymer transport protein ExbD
VPIAVNLAPMIDVTFLLLIFFLVTTTFERPEGVLASDLPRVGGTQAVPLPISPIVVRVSLSGPGDDDYLLRIDRFETRIDSIDALPDVLRQIQQQPGFDTETPVVIIAANDVRWDHVVGCWNAALRAGCSRIAFGEP